MITIRKVRSDEVKKLQDLNDEVFKDNVQYDPDLKMDWAQSELGANYFKSVITNPECHCLIAEENEKPIGYIASGPKSIPYSKSKYFEIENMGVIPEYRSHGVGSQLIEKCIEWAKEKGYQKIYVNAYFANIRGVEFYKKNGFSEFDIGLLKEL